MQLSSGFRNSFVVIKFGGIQNRIPPRSLSPLMSAIEWLPTIAVWQGNRSGAADAAAFAAVTP